MPGCPIIHFCFDWVHCWIFHFSSLIFYFYLKLLFGVTLQFLIDNLEVDTQSMKNGCSLCWHYLFELYFSFTSHLKILSMSKIAKKTPLFKVTLMKIRKFADIFVFKKINANVFILWQLLVFEICTLKISEMFRTEIIEYVKNEPYF